MLDKLKLRIGKWFCESLEQNGLKLVTLEQFNTSLYQLSVLELELMKHQIYLSDRAYVMTGKVRRTLLGEPETPNYLPRVMNYRDQALTLTPGHPFRY